MTGYSFSTPVWDGGTWVTPAVAEVAVARKVNGPEDQPRKQDAPAGWDKIDWREHEGQVRRLRQRIFTAAQEQDWPRVRNLQKLMLRSRSNTLVSVRQVTQRNAGRKTAGIDGEVALTPEARADVAVRVHQSISSWRPRAVRRVYVPKASNRAKLRPLGIPVILDRCHQNRVKNALEPEWEARFGARVYGFRPGRSCQDAAVALHTTLSSNAKRLWILDADLSAAFDKIDHAFLLRRLGTFPARDMIAGWLKAGVFEAGKGFAPTEEGTPQGGIISPLLLNVALHGLEEASGVRYSTAPSARGKTQRDSPVTVAYADDFVVCCHSRQQAESIRARLAGWLAERGLSLNEDKTRIVRLSQGFDFLGWNFRRYPVGKTLVKPSKGSVAKHRQRLADEMRRLRGSNAGAVIGTLNPVIRGWAAYHRSQVSSETFSSLGHYTWKLTWKWARWSHPGKGTRWTIGRYYGKFCPSREDKWVFGDRDTGAYLLNHAWMGILRHVMVKGRASPDDPDLTGYWENRRRKKTGLALDAGTLSLLARQENKCPHCGDPLIDASSPPASPEEWEDWWLGTTRQDIPRAPSTAGPARPPAERGTAPALMHMPCHRARTTAGRRDAA